MKPGAIIHRYIFKELLSPFIISLAFFMFVFLMTELVDITDWVINYQVGFTTVLLMLAYSIPSFLQYIVPMSTMIGVLLAFLKMSSDNEIVALKAGGMSIYAMLPPVIVFCLLGCLITMTMSVYGEPWGRISSDTITRRLKTASIAAFLKERVFKNFGDSDSGMELYVTRIDPQQNTLGEVFIEYSRKKDNPITITAPRGRIEEDPVSQVYHLKLEQGQINQVDIETDPDTKTDTVTVSTISFDTGTAHPRLDLPQSIKLSDDEKDEKEMKIGELRKYIRSREQKDEKYYLALIAFHGKFSLPFACFALGILAVPLGIQSKSARHPFGFGLGFFFFLVYYLILSTGEVYGRTGHYPPLIGMWAPNIVMGGIGGLLLVRCARERNIGIGWFLHLLQRKSRSDTDSEENSSTTKTQ